MGTEYVHREPPPTEITVTKGSSMTIDIPHITSALTIGNTLKINMRQKNGNELNFVSLSNNISSTHVIIDAFNVASGEYELLL